MAFTGHVLSLTGSFLQMGCPGPLGEKVSDIQRSSTPADPRRAPGEAIPDPVDSDLVPATALAAALVLLFLLLSSWLVWHGHLQGSC